MSSDDTPQADVPASDTEEYHASGAEPMRIAVQDDQEHMLQPMQDSGIQPMQGSEEQPMQGSEEDHVQPMQPFEQDADEGIQRLEHQQEQQDAFDADSLPADLPPGHPLLRRAQQALRKQLQVQRARLEAELREKAAALKAAKQHREDLGVELYGFQQQLAKLQLQLEKAQEQHASVAQMRQQAEEQVVQLRHVQQDEEQLTAQERQKVDKFQGDLDKLAATLRQVEAYNAEMKSEIAVTRRATYAAEGSVQRLEKGKKDQDLLIDHLHGQIKGYQRQLQVLGQQLSAQQRETRAARETLAEAEAEMEDVAFEKKQLTAQWQSSVAAMQRRDEALKALEAAETQQGEQARSIENEIQAFRRDILREQVHNEQLTSILRRMEGESKFLEAQNTAAQGKRTRLQEAYAQLQEGLQATEGKLATMRTEAKVLESERLALEKAVKKVNDSIMEVEAQVLHNLSEQTTAEKSSQKTAQETQQLRKQVYDEEMAVVQLQNEMARLQVDILNTEAHNGRLREALQMLDADLRARMDTISKTEGDIKRRSDEIEKKTKEVDLLNRKFERLTANAQGEENLGPLEATINNLTREIGRKGDEGRVLQRRWVQWQAELVGLQADNNRLAESLLRLKSEHTVVLQKRKRLAQQQEYVAKEVKDLERGIGHLRHSMARYDALTAENNALKRQLAEDGRNLETRIANELKDMEEAAAAVQGSIDAARGEKGQMLESMVDAERQVMLWERKLQLEREVRAALDPSVGADVVDAMRREVHRMQLHLGDLGRLQEKLISDMERAISKRDTINMKGRAASLKKSPDITESALKRALGELERSVQNVRRETAAAGGRVQQLDAAREAMAEELTVATSRVDELREQEAAAQQAVEAASLERLQALLATSTQQKLAKFYEDAEAGRYRLKAAPDALPAGLQRAEERRASIVAVMQDLMRQQPDLQPALQRALLRQVVLTEA